MTVIDAVRWSSEHTWASDTRKSALDSVANFYRWASTIYATMFDVDRLPRVKASPAAPRPADDLALERLKRSSDWRVSLAARLASEVGLRRAECVRIKPSTDIISDLLGLSLIVHGKGNKDRIVPLPSTLADELIERGPGYVFPGQIAGHLSPAQIGKIVNRELPPGVTMHALRHRFATRAYERTGDLVSVQKILGHSSPQTTLRYLAIADTTLRKVVESAA
ncbi:tyrosine-type recombinase/integrase [Schaalia sp. ZJ1691]|uniref:tyrosine-type recombinase/integrase n=1 Tax=Schaalia sp. ZJ1691 TaxID=2709404 RepID=UPI0013ECF9F6|nr:tyrosine-type recombinase/integrase [Schaalia sp. ZJ1691]